MNMMSIGTSLVEFPSKHQLEEKTKLMVKMTMVIMIMMMMMTMAIMMTIMMMRDQSHLFFYLHYWRGVSCEEVDWCTVDSR